MKLTFKLIYDAVDPDEPIYSWFPDEKRNIVMMANKKRNADSLLLEMGFNPDDWTNAEKKRIAKTLWPK